MSRKRDSAALVPGRRSGAASVPVCPLLGGTPSCLGTAGLGSSRLLLLMLKAAELEPSARTDPCVTNTCEQRPEPLQKRTANWRSIRLGPRHERQEFSSGPPP